MPVFEITEWVSMDTDSVEDSDEADLEVAAEPDAADGTRRRRRVA